VSYTRDLGIQMSAFTGTANITSGTDANWSTFLGMVSDPSTLLWNVVAGDSVGGAALELNYFATSNTAPTTIDNAFNTQLNQFNTINNYIGNVNTADGTGGNFAANASTIIENATNPTAYAGGGTFGSKFGGKETAFSTTALLGQDMSFFLLQNSDTTASHAIKVTQFGSVDGFGIMNLAANGTLTYSVPTPSAVPVPAAAWLFGSGLAGMVGVARRKNHNA
jgi:hypothetical protein